MILPRQARDKHRENSKKECRFVVSAVSFPNEHQVWTLFDYYGESHGWPKVSSAYGQFDIAGFMKNTARCDLQLQVRTRCVWFVPSLS